MDCTLVVLAAGLGSRFKGGIKQLEAFGPSGEIIMDYSVYDALTAGFNKVVFIIRHDIKEAFDEIIGKRISKHIKVEYVYQELDCLPAGYTVPQGRIKPWGHGHAVYCCRNAVKEPFAVINADDFYGKQSFSGIHEFLTNEPSTIDGKLNMCLSGFILKNTLSRIGAVNRGVCVTENGLLKDVFETYNIRRENDGLIHSGTDDDKLLDENSYVSMNMWGCPQGFFELLDEEFNKFIIENKDSDKAEFLLPTAIDHMIKDDKAVCSVLESRDRWFGVTYAEDKPEVKREISALCDNGMYPCNLW